MTTLRIGFATKVTTFAVVVVALLLAPPMLSRGDGTRDAWTEAAAEAQDPCFELSRSTSVAELSDLGINDVYLPSSWYSDYDPSAMDCFSDLLLGRIEALSIAFRDGTGGAAVVVLMPRTDVGAERMVEWREFLSREYAGEDGSVFVQTEHLLLMARADFDLASLDIGAKTSFWQEVITR